eukprot:COSAG02_NODE_1835_length_10714_cov_7.585437_4_plen_895_part_00
MSSNNVGNITETEEGRFWAHLIVAAYFSVATYAVSKRDILGRNSDQSQFLSIFNWLYLDILVPETFWWGAHCRIKGASSYEHDDEDEWDDGAESNSMITVTIAEPTGLVHSIEIAPSATVQELKEQMCAHTVASPQRLQLAWDGQVLEEESLSLKAYCLLTGSHLEAIPKVHSIDPALTRPVSPVLMETEQAEDPAAPGVANLTNVTRPASPELATAIARDEEERGESIRAAVPTQAEPEASLIDDLGLVALPPRPPVPAVGIRQARAASPGRADRPLELAEKMRGGDEPLLSGESPPLPLSLAAAEPFAQSPKNQTAASPRRDLRSTGFEFGYNPQYSPSDALSIRRRGRDALNDRKMVSPARNALLIRRISTKYEHIEDPTRKKGWLRNTLWKVFHRPEKWKVRDILLYRTGAHGLACFGSKECFKCHEVTAFIVFESPEMPLDIIRRHRDATQKGWLPKLLQPLQNVCKLCTFVCCPNLSYNRTESSSPRSSAIAAPIVGLETIFGRSRDTDRLKMPQWELQPGPTKEDLMARADSKGRWKNLNRPRWQKILSTWFGTIALVVLSGLMIFWSTISVSVNLSSNQTKMVKYDVQNGHVDLSGSSPGANFLAKYIPTLISFMVIVGILPTLIDFVAYVVEPHYLMSDVYRSVLNKNLLLLLISSLILPSLALTRLQDDVRNNLMAIANRATSLYDTITSGDDSYEICHDNSSSLDDPGTFWAALWGFISYPATLLYTGFGSAFGGEAAGYFYRYMTHTSLLGLGATLFLIPDKFYRTLSWLFRWEHERRMVWEFPLEYNYSICCSTFAITFVYAIPHPPILFLGLIYAILRAFGDKCVARLTSKNLSVQLSRGQGAHMTFCRLTLTTLWIMPCLGNQVLASVRARGQPGQPFY